MRVAIDPCQLRSWTTEETIAAVAEAGFEAIELSPREGLLQHRGEDPPDAAEVKRLKQACASSGVEVASLFIVQPWASRDPDERRSAVRGMRVAARLANELGCRRINTELTGNPGDVDECRASFLRSLDELMPSFEDFGLEIAVEPHPYDFLETNAEAIDLIASLSHPRIGYLFCCPHLFYLGGDPQQSLQYARDRLIHVHVADTFRPSRMILNPPSDQRIHQHLDIGQGELDWESIFDLLDDVGFDDLLTVAAFAWHDAPIESMMRNRSAVDRLLSGVRQSHRTATSGREGEHG